MLKENIATFYPQAMRSLPNWVLWKKDKVPYSPLYDGHASSTNPRTWGTFDVAYNKLQKDNDYCGIGFVFSRDTGLVFIDLDHCIGEKNNLSPVAINVINTIGKDTYIELSQSGTGLHIFAYGEIPETIKKKEIEMYNHGRYVAMTGRALSPCEPSDKHTEILKVYEKYKPLEKTSFPRIVTGELLNLSDDEIIKRASNSRNGELFRKLMSGDFSDYPSQSEADLELCKILAFWSDRDSDTIERIFTSSGLCRSKWTRRRYYRERTIQRACDHTNKSISELIAQKKSEEANKLES